MLNSCCFYHITLLIFFLSQNFHPEVSVTTGVSHQSEIQLLCYMLFGFIIKQYCVRFDLKLHCPSVLCIKRIVVSAIHIMYLVS